MYAKVSFVRALDTMRLIYPFIAWFVPVIALNLETPDFEIFDFEHKGAKCEKIFSATSISLTKPPDQEK